MAKTNSAEFNSTTGLMDDMQNQAMKISNYK
jgi:hypothetical protein